MFDTPVAFLIFRRPELTARVFAEIARVKPRRLFVVADGPSSRNDVDRCEAARRIACSVDWNCDLQVNFSDRNLGSFERVSSGLDWVFGKCDQAIILEDDCVPHPTFFPFCAELLSRFENDSRIMHISGNNFQFGRRRGAASYYFSFYSHNWGWATWSRAWKRFDGKLRDWQTLRDTSWLQEHVGHPRLAQYWAMELDSLEERGRGIWDTRWLYTMWRQEGLAVIPNTNLVSNIGFGVDATHTTDPDSLVNNVPCEPMRFPLVHPPSIERDREADEFTGTSVFSPPMPSLGRRVVNKLLRTFRRAFKGS